jgi:tellurite resistance protein
MPKRSASIVPVGMSTVQDWETRRLDATVQAAALCAYVDGHLAEEERDQMCECIATHASSEDEARRLISLARDLPEWVDSPPSGFRASQFAEIKSALRTPEEREHAFYLAVQVANAHRGISVYETSLLLNLMFELDIEGNYAREIIDRARAQRKK